MDALDKDVAAADADLMADDDEEIVKLPQAVGKRHFPDVWEKLSDEQRETLIGEFLTLIFVTF
jgi:hypothetical protein